ncbi:MAG: CHRD domain-containing protein [Pseudomonadales bacterium]
MVLGLERDPGNVAIWRTPGDNTITPEQFTAAGAGEMYFNVHSDANQAGEIRGQIVP